MSLLRVSLTVLSLAICMGSAGAFQEQRQGGAAPTAAPAPAEGRPAADFSAPSAPDTGKSSGTEVRLPGLGKLGSLPRMDFGLELLYGATDPKAPVGPVQRDERDDDLTIRGSVRHKF